MNDTVAFSYQFFLIPSDANAHADAAICCQSTALSDAHPIVVVEAPTRCKSTLRDG
jgi:hypothetical protein